MEGEVSWYFVVTHLHNKSFIYFFTGCQLILGHAVDRDLLLLVQGEVRGLIKDFNTFEKNLASHQKRLEALEEKLQEESENRSEEIKKVLERLSSFDKQLARRVQVLEEEVDRLKQGQTEMGDSISQVKHEMEQIKLQMKTEDDKPGKLRL